MMLCVRPASELWHSVKALRNAWHAAASVSNCRILADIKKSCGSVSALICFSTGFALTQETTEQPALSLAWNEVNIAH
jgi:hypothetical protein